MSRNGSGVYSLPAGSTIANGDTSDATDLNTPLSDLEADANTARPIVAGGTGATSASAARTALGVVDPAGTETISGDWTFTAPLVLTSALPQITFNDSDVTGPSNIRQASGTFLIDVDSTDVDADSAFRVDIDGTARATLTDTEFTVKQLVIETNSQGVENDITLNANSVIGTGQTLNLVGNQDGGASEIIEFFDGDGNGPGNGGATRLAVMFDDTENTSSAEEVIIRRKGDARYLQAERFTSSAQTISTGGLITVAHGLSSTPKIVTARLVCTSAEHNYAVDDEIIVDWHASYPAQSIVNTPRVDGTNIRVRFANTTSCFVAGDKGTGALNLLTNSSWDLYIEAMT